MLTSINAILGSFKTLLEKLNSTPLKRLIIYFMLAYPVVIVYFYHEEISLMMTLPSKTVKINDIAIAQDRCFKLRKKHGAETVMLYVYQPSGRNKTYKERVVFSTDHYVPMSSLQTIELFSRTRILEDLRKDGYSLITPTSGHHESSILQAYDFSKAYVTVVRDNVSEQIVAEVVWIFKEDKTIDTKELITEGQIFAYDIKN